MATDKNFVIKNGLTINGSEIITSAGNLTNVGSIATTGITVDSRLILDGSKIYDNSTNGNSKGFRIGGAGLVPLNGVGTDINNVVDIGTSTYKFKDLYLSGYVSANALASPDGTQIVFPNNNGNVMIGSTGTPSAKLHVSGTISSGAIESEVSGADLPSQTTANLYLVDTRSLAANTGGSIVFSSYYQGTTAVSGGPYIKGYKENANSGDYGYGLKFGVRENGQGTTGPVFTLNSLGNATFTGSIESTGTINIDPADTTLPNTYFSAERYNDSNGKLVFGAGELDPAGGTAGETYIGNHNRRVHIGAVFDGTNHVPTAAPMHMMIDTDGDLYVSQNNVHTRWFEASTKNLSNIGTISSGNITTTGYLRGPATFTIDPATHGDNTGTVVIAGNLQIDGTTTTINSTTLTVDDKNITLASGSTNAGAANGAGITVDCGSDTDATFTYDGTNDEWDFNKNVTITSTGTIGTSTPGNGYLQVTDGTNTLAFDPNEIYSNDDLVITTGGDFDIRNGSFSMGNQIVITSSKNIINVGTITASGLITGDRFLSGLGTAASPAYKVGDSDSGFYDSGANIIGVTLGGALEYEFKPTELDLKTNALKTGLITVEGNLLDDQTMINIIQTNTSSDISTQESFIDFTFIDANANNYPQVKIGAQVGQNADADSTIKEGSGAFVVHTSNAVDSTAGAQTGMAERMRVDYRGHVGIGTSSPDQKLHVEFSNTDTSFSGGSGGAWGSDGIRIENTSSTADTMAMLHFRNNDSDIHIAGIRQGADDSDLGFFFEGSEKVRFTKDGKVGISSSDPSYPLDLRNPSDTNQVFRVYFPDSSTTQIGTSRMTGGATQGLFVEGQTGVRFGVSGTEYGRFHSNGNFGIGYTTPYSKLWVEKEGINLDDFSFEDASSIAHLTLAGSNAHVRMHLGTMDVSPYGVYIQGSYDNTPDASGTGNSGTEPLLLNPLGGNVGIGTTNPQTKLHIEGSNVGVPTNYGGLVYEAVDAQIDVVSNSSGTWGSAINFVEGASTSANTDVWSIARKTTGGAGDSSLNFNFGTVNQHDNTNRMALSSGGNLTVAGTISSGVLSVNGGTTNVVATFQSTDSIAAIKLQDSAGNVELSASGSTFRVQPSGSTAVFEVDSSGNTDIAGSITASGAVNLTTTGSTSPAITFNTNSGTDSGADMAIRAVGEGLDFYEPEDGDKLHMRIIDDGGVNAVFGLHTGTGDGTERIDPSGNLVNIGTISSSYFTATSNINLTGVAGFTVGGGRIGFDQSGTRSWTMGASSGYLNVFSGDGNGDLNLANSIGLRQNGTLVLDSSRNLSNIGTITASGYLRTSSNGIYGKMSDEWHTANALRGGNFSADIGNDTTVLKLFPASPLDESGNTRAANDYNTGIAFMHLDPDNSSWGTGYTGAQAWIGLKVESLPGQELDSFVIATNGSSTAGTMPTERFKISSTGAATFTGSVDVGGNITASGGTVDVEVLKADDTGTTPGSCKLHVGALNSAGSSAVAQFGGFIRAAQHLILHSAAGTGDAVFMSYTGGDVDFRTGEGSGANSAVMVNSLKVGTATVITSAAAVQNISSISMSGNLYMSKSQPWIIIENTTEDGGGIVFNDNQAGASSTSGPGSSSQQFRITYNSGSETLVMGHDDDSYAGFNFGKGGAFTASGDVTAFSDERLKDNIETLDGKKALQMRGVSFTKNGKEGSGVIAQELEEVAPELVTTDKVNGIKSVAYGNLVGYLIEAVKEQQKQIEELKEEVSSLRSKN